MFDPVPQPGAVCGWVDILDFPLDPPNGELASGGRDFGIFRGRYGKYHAGEDWGLSNRQNFGEPVYSIGHGEITYAEPEGWGADKGVVIIRHTFPDGRNLLSFYGHLDPPSVTILAGSCVRRGEQIGQIGRPRTPPHLHFEIRTILPISPGPGYWPDDPVRAGWLPPSQTIWGARIAAAPGVEWVQPARGEQVGELGFIANGTFLQVESYESEEEKDENFQGQITALNVATGGLDWRMPVSSTYATLSESGTIVYIADQSGGLVAYSLPNGEVTLPADGRVFNLAEMWRIDLTAIGIPELMPLPGDGVAMVIGRKVTAFSAAGEPVWELSDILSPLSWALWGDTLIFSTPSPGKTLWSVGAGEPEVWQTPAWGRPVVSGEAVFLYAEEGIYRLDVESQAAEVIINLGHGSIQNGDLLPLGGGLLLVHEDAHDRKLTAYWPDGSLRWERSYKALAGRRPKLMGLAGMGFLLLERREASSLVADLYAIDMNTADLTYLFSGGTRQFGGESWFRAVDLGRMLVSLGGGTTFVLDIRPALESALRGETFQ